MVLASYLELGMNMLVDHMERLLGTVVEVCEVKVTMSGFLNY